MIIKAVAGGGGKGMRVAHNAVAFAKEYNSARNEAEKAFGNGDVYIEKFLEAPRHIEIQVLGDQYGNVIHSGRTRLFCSTPSPKANRRSSLTFYF